MLAGYLDLSRAMKRVRLPRQLSEKISLAAQGRIGCGTCAAAHTAAARAAGHSDRRIADVIGLVSLDLLTSSFNLVAGIRPADD